jgi:hypothetical protein
MRESVEIGLTILKNRDDPPQLAPKNASAKCAAD